ncbi:alanine racemase [Myxococcota bacterium]|nr:alanine racemase [Myxococcota bacterium]MBU1379472.1 alanine racemase [Myxococcota bacterium]MBU1496175.1 alanine racemase [Myxococcota bacterium]
MNKVVINLDALRHNLARIDRIITLQGASWTVVTKALCGHTDTIKALEMMGVKSIADSRLDNLRAISRETPELEKWYLRLPHLSAVKEIVELADLSLNSEIRVIRALGKEALRQGKIHNIIIMVELGDLREGITPGSLTEFYREVFETPGIKVMGLGAQIGCLGGASPNEDQVAQLGLYRELLELKYQEELKFISAGSTIFLPHLFEGGHYRSINHYRIGEALFLGTNLITGGKIPGLRDDVITLEAEIAEIKKKSLTANSGTNSAPFDMPNLNYEPGQRGFRALVTVGNLDTDVNGLKPVVDEYVVAGGSSDITVVNMGSNPNNLTVGDTITFKTNYSAFLGLMNDPYIPKEIYPPLQEFKERYHLHSSIEIPRILDDDSGI